MILPIFLCAVCALVMMGQMLIAEGEISHALSRTAFICAREESVKEKAGGAGPDAVATFYSILQADNLCASCIPGGRRGIVITMSQSHEEGKVRLTANYSFRLPLPVVAAGRLSRRLVAQRRMFTGYILHRGETEEEDPIVYVARHGSVYHTSMACTHISLRIKGTALVKKMLEAQGIRPCEKCIQKGRIPASIYITAEGDCYHSRLSCSGLTRTVRAVRLSEVRGMRMCARCAKKGR